MSQIEGFREETRIWLEKNCPTGAKGVGQVPTGSTKIKIEDPEVMLWLDRMIEKGWTAPTWPKEFGGAGLSTEEYVVLIEEMRRIDARPALGGMGTSMIGPTLLEYGTDEQKQEHLPKIAKAEVANLDPVWEKIREAREKLAEALRQLGFSVTPSQANFLLATLPDGHSAELLYRQLKSENILVRFFDQERLQDKLRISVGTPSENASLLAALTSRFA